VHVVPDTCAVPTRAEERRLKEEATRAKADAARAKKDLRKRSEENEALRRREEELIEAKEQKRAGVCEARKHALQLEEKMRKEEARAARAMEEQAREEQLRRQQSAAKGGEIARLQKEAEQIKAQCAKLESEAARVTALEQQLAAMAAREAVNKSEWVGVRSLMCLLFQRRFDRVLPMCRVLSCHGVEEGSAVAAKWSSRRSWRRCSRRRPRRTTGTRPWPPRWRDSWKLRRRSHGQVRWHRTHARMHAHTTIDHHCGH
jgi:hypothetical protein